MRRKGYLFGVLLLAMGLSITGCEKPEQKIDRTDAQQSKPYQAKEFSQLKGMEGFSTTLLENHFKLYQGYVKHTNMLMDQLQALLQAGNVSSPEFTELKRRLGFEFDGMRLHELYFSNLGGKTPLDSKSPLYDAIAKNFGSMETWKKDFMTTGSMRGVGWVILYADPRSGNLIDFWINDHEVNHPAGCVPLLVMDVWEHAYMLDYQLDRGKYMEAFFNNINWPEVAARFDQSVAAANVAKERPESVVMPTSESLRMFEKPHETE